MAALMSEEQLRHTALSVLEQQLGPVEALRFLALVRREPFDYQAWREQAFADLSVEELFQRMQESETSST